MALDNQDRAHRAESAMEFHYQDTQTDVTDLLTDLMHYCNIEGRDFAKYLQTATIHFESEK